MESLKIIGAENMGDLKVLLTFNDNKTTLVDIGEFIKKNPHPQYNKYLDPRKFRKFHLENNNIVWGKNWDLMFPIEDLYNGHIG